MHQPAHPLARFCATLLTLGLVGAGCGSGPITVDAVIQPDTVVLPDLPVPPPDRATPPPDVQPDLPSDVPVDAALDQGPDGAPDLTLASGERCDSAIALTPGQELAGQDLTGRTDDHDLTVNPSTACAPAGTGFGGGELVYTVSVPPGQRVRVTATPTAGSGADLVLALALDCADLAGSCLGIVDNPGEASAPERLTYLNTTAAPVTVFAVVDPFDVDLVGPFSIRADLYTAGTGDLCASAPVLASGVPQDGDTSPQNNDYDVSIGTAAACSVGFGLDGSDTTYRISVPGGMRVTVTVTPAGWDAAVALVTSCESAGPTCLAAQDAAAGAEPETVSFDNTTANAMDVFALVDSFDPAEAGPFTIVAALTSLP